MVFCKQNVNLNEVAEKNLTKKLLIISILLLLNISSINKSSDVTKLKGTSYLSLVLFLEKSSFFWSVLHYLLCYNFLETVLTFHYVYSDKLHPWK
jgi:hypothetical protein